MQNCIAKLFSTVLNSRLVSFYEDKFVDQQFGFRANHRTTDTIFILKSLITKYLVKEKRKIFVCFVDLSRAFDTVWHMNYYINLWKMELAFTVIKDMYKSCQSAVKIKNEYLIFF